MKRKTYYQVLYDFGEKDKFHYASSKDYALALEYTEEVFDIKKGCKKVYIVQVDTKTILERMKG